MDKKSMGTFLTDLRKEKGLTQQEVADNLNMSNKTISKWERDEGYPEITMLPEIAKFYEITTDELLQGKRNESKNIKEIVIEEIKYEKLDKFMLFSKVLSIIGVGLLALFSFIAKFSGFGLNGFYLSLVFAIVSLVGTGFVIAKKTKENITKKDFEANSLTFFLFMVNIFFIAMLGMNSYFGVQLNLTFLLIPAIFLSIITTFFFRSLLKKKLGLDAVSLQKKKLKKKLTLTASVITTLVIVVTIILSVFGVTSIEPNEYTFDFVDSEVYGSYEKGVNEYNKVKRVFTEGVTLYEIISEEDDSLILNEIHIISEETPSGYNVIDRYNAENEIEFDTEKGKTEFIEEFVVYDSGNDILHRMDEQIIFDDVNKRISFIETVEQEDFAKLTAGVYVVWATAALSVMYGAMILAYNKKRT